MKEYPRTDRLRCASRSSIIGTINFPRVLQFTWWTCGPCSAYSVMQHFGCVTAYSDVVNALGTTRRGGTSEDAMVRVLEANGLSVEPWYYETWGDLMSSLSKGRAVVADMDRGRHYVVVYGYDPETDRVHLSDPSPWRVWGRSMPRPAFMARWTGQGLETRTRTRTQLRSMRY